MESLAALKVFLRVAEARSFTLVGRQLGLSSSAVGKTVRRLEGRIGVCLFHRNTRTVALTQEGHYFAERCRRILQEIEAIEQQFAQTRGKPKGRLRVGVPLVGSIVLPLLGRFMQTYPDIELDMDFTDRTIDIVEGGYDVVICSGVAKDSRLKTRCLGQYGYLVVGAPSYFDHAGIPQTPVDLERHVCLHQKHWGSGKLQPWPLVCPEAGRELALPVTAVSSAIEPLVSLAEAGVGLVCVPDFAVRRQVVEGSVVTVLDRFVERDASLRAVWPTSDYVSPKLRAFVGFLAKHLAVAPTAACEPKIADDIAATPRSVDPASYYGVTDRANIRQVVL